MHRGIDYQGWLHTEWASAHISPALETCDYEVMRRTCAFRDTRVAVEHAPRSIAFLAPVPASSNALMHAERKGLIRRYAIR